MIRLSADELTSVEQNLFEGARALARERPDFPWHRDSAGRATASQKESSQALAIDVFGTVDRLASKDAILNAWSSNWGFDSDSLWKMQLERLVPRSLLNEPRRTQIDASAETARALILFECKFTEPDGGSCSQTEAIEKGANKGKVQCHGNYQSVGASAIERRLEP